MHEGLHFRCGGQTVCFGDSPQVCCHSLTATPVSNTTQTGQSAFLSGAMACMSSISPTNARKGHPAISRCEHHLSDKAEAALYVGSLHELLACL